MKMGLSEVPEIEFTLKRSQHLNATYRNIVGPVFASPGQTIATLLGATYCTRLETLLKRISTCCELKIELVRMPGRNIVARTWPNDYNIMQHLQKLHEKI